MVVTRTTVWVDGNILTASALNGEFNNLLNAPDIVDADISGGAGISPTKIAGTAATESGNNTYSGINSFAATKQTLTTDSDGGTITFDMNVSNTHTVTLGGNRILSVANVTVGQVFLIELVQDTTGGRTVTWFGGIKWPNNTIPTVTGGATKTDVYGFQCISSGIYLGFILSQNS